MQSFAEWFSKKTVGGFVPPIPETPQYETPELPPLEEEEEEEPKKPLSFSEWFAKKAGKPAISAPGGIPATPLAPPLEKAPPWGTLARGPRVPGTLQTPVSPYTAFQALPPAPGEQMPSPEEFAQLLPEQQEAWKKWHGEAFENLPISSEMESLPPSQQLWMQKRMAAQAAGKTPQQIRYAMVGKTAGVLKPLWDLEYTGAQMGTKPTTELAFNPETGQEEQVPAGMSKLNKATGQYEVDVQTLNKLKADQDKYRQNVAGLHKPMLLEHISDKIQTGQDLSGLESIVNRAAMLGANYVDSFTLGVFKDLWDQKLVPQDAWDELLGQVGKFAGFVTGGPKIMADLVAGKLVGPGVKWVSQALKASPKMQAWITQLAQPIRLSVMMASENLPGFIEAPLKEKGKILGEGYLTGLIFQGAGLIDSPKYPTLSKVARQVGVRALGSVAGQYSPDFWGELAALPAGEGSLKERLKESGIFNNLFNEALYSSFVIHGKSPKSIMADFNRAQMEAARLSKERGEVIEVSPMLRRIVGNLEQIKQLAFSPAPAAKARIPFLEGENQQLHEMMRQAYLPVPPPAERIFIAGPGGKITPPGETPERIAARQRLEERHEQQRQAEGLAARTAEYEKERQAMLPVPVPGEPEPGFYMGMRGEVPREVALEPEGKRMKRELIAERQLEAQQRRIEERLAKERPAEVKPEIPAPSPPLEPTAPPKPIPEKAKPIVAPKVPKAEVAVVKGKPIAAKAEVKIPAGVKPEPLGPTPAAKPVVPAPKPASAPAKGGLEAKVPGVFGRHVPPGEYALRGNFLYKGKRAVLDLNVMAKDVVYKLRDAKRRVTEGTLQPEGFDKLKKAYMAEAVKAYEGMKPWKEFPKPAEVYKAREARVAKEREIVARAIKSKEMVPEVVKPFTEEAAKSERANALQAHFDARDSQAKAILEILFPQEKRAISRLGLGTKARLPEGGKLPRIEYAGKVRKEGISLKQPWPTREELVGKIEKDLFGRIKEKVSESKKLRIVPESTSSWFDKEAEKKIKDLLGRPESVVEVGGGGRTPYSHAGERVSIEAEKRSKTWDYQIWDSRRNDFLKGLDPLRSHEQEITPDQVKIQIKRGTGEITVLDKGENISPEIAQEAIQKVRKMPQPERWAREDAELKAKGLPAWGTPGYKPIQPKGVVGIVAEPFREKGISRKEMEDLELELALRQRRIPGTNIKMPDPPKELDPATNYLIKRDTVAAEDRERHFLPGATVIENVRRMGPVGKTIAKAMDNFVYQQNAHTSRDQAIGSATVRMIGESMKKAGELKDVPFFHRGEKIGKRLIDLVENKVQPANEYEIAAKGLVKELFKGIANDAEALGMKISTAFGREIPWAERENYFPQVWKKAGLEKFLDSESTPFRHLRTIYLEHLAKVHFPDVYKTDSAEALRRMEVKWRDLRRDLKTKPFSNLEMSRILDEEVLGKLQTKWAEMRPGEAFPLERDTGTHVLMNYLAGAQTRIAWVRNFGKDVLEKGSFRPELIDRLVPEMKNEANYKYTMNFFHQYLTRSGFDTKTTRLLRTTRTAQLWKLGTAFIPNSTQWFTNVMPLVSTKAGLAGFMDAARVLTGNKELKEFFVKSGARTMKSALREAMMEDQSKINGFADLMLKVHLFNGTEYFNALEAAMTGRRKAMEISGKLAKRPEAYRAPQWERELRKLGLEDADIAKIKGGKPLAGGEEQIFRAMFEMRKQTQFLSDAFHLPKLWSHPVGRVATQFKNFAYNQTRLLLTEPLAEAWRFAKTWGREGDLSKLVKAMIILPAAGAAVTKAKEETYKLLGIHFYENLLAGKSWPLKYLIYMANAGALGIVADSIGALAFGSKGITQLIGGPTFSDIAGVLEATGKSMNEVWTAVKNKNPGWLAHRGKAIGEYWLRVGERISPDARILIQNFFKEWKAAKAAINWSQVYRSATKTYKETYKLKGEYQAQQFWDAWMATQGREYSELFGKMPDKPTEKEIDEWWEEQGKPTVERMHMPGKSETQPEGGPVYLW